MSAVTERFARATEDRLIRPHSCSVVLSVSIFWCAVIQKNLRPG